jgi:uncharacterized protein (DUF433 family)
MMIAKKTGPWQRPHEHHESRRRHAKLEGWPAPKVHTPLIGEQLDASAVVYEYPPTLEKLFARAIARCPSISVDKDIMQGQPCIFGTRIPVRSVLRVLEHNASADAVRESYPHLTTQQVEDVLYFSQLILELPSGVDETATIA